MSGLPSILKPCAKLGPRRIETRIVEGRRQSGSAARRLHTWYTPRMSTASLLDRFLDPVVEFLSADAAQKIIDLRIDQELQARLDALADKANEGTLSAAEQEEYEGYIDDLDTIAIFKLKAKAALRRQGL